MRLLDGFFYELLKLFRRHNHFAWLGSLFLTDDTRLSQLIHNAGRPVKSDLKDAL